MKKRIGLLLSLLILSFSTLAGNAVLPNVYPAIVSAKGKMTLEAPWKSLNFTFPMSTEFLALVPKKVTPGTYEAVFRGGAIVSDHIIKFDGWLNASGNVFWVKFGIEKPDSELKSGKYKANGTLSLDIKEAPPEQLEVTWVLMKGNITSYGERKALGGIVAHARMGPMMKQWANVHGLFTLQETLTGNRSFYVFKLVNVLEVDYDGDLHIDGLWNVLNVTITHYDGEFNLNTKLIVENDTGQLEVYLSQENFTLSIKGMEQEIRGDIVFYHLMFHELFKERGVPPGDFNRDRKVDIMDVGRVAKAYGSTLGRQGYDFDLDIEFNYVIDVMDVANVVRDFGKEY